MKAAALAKAAEKEAERLKAAEAANAAKEAKLAAEQKTREEKLAALTPPADKSDQPTAVDLPRSLQAELRRVGCNTGAVDGNWNAASQRSLDLFNKHAGLKLDVKVASVDALDLVKGKTGRICPLVCEHGFKADGDRCAKITCRAGYRSRRRQYVRKDRSEEAGRETRRSEARKAGARKNGSNTGKAAGVGTNDLWGRQAADP